MKTRKIVALLLSVMMMMSIVMIASAAERVEISWTFWGTPDEYAAVEAAVAKFEAEQDRIQVNIVQIPRETVEAELTSMAAAGTLPDSSFMAEGIVISWAADGMLADISDMYGETEAKPLDSLTFKYEGKPVAYATCNEILLMYYNKDMFDAAGVAYPSTNPEEAWDWDEFVAVAKQLTFDANGLNPDDEGFDPNNIVQYGVMVENLAWQLEVWALSNGGGFYSEDGSEVIIGNPEAIEAIQKVADLYLVHHVAPLSAGLTDDGVQRSLIAGNVAMTTNGQWNVGTCLSGARDEGLNYGVAPLPFMKEKVTINTAGAAVVFASAPNLEEAMEWVKWYTKIENSWFLVELGIWMPPTADWYTEEALTRKWVENPAFPPYEEYKAAVVDYARDYARPASWFFVNNTAAFNDLLAATLGDVWNGNVTAKEAILANLDALKAVSNGE